MPNGNVNWIAGFIWNIADDVLRDVYVRGKYRDVILPMTVVRRLDAVLEPTKEAVLKLSKQLDDAGVANKHAALCQTCGNAFYNVSPFTLRESPRPRQTTAAKGRFRGLPRRLLTECPGDSGQVRV